MGVFLVLAAGGGAAYLVHVRPWERKAQPPARDERRETSPPLARSAAERALIAAFHGSRWGDVLREGAEVVKDEPDLAALLLEAAGNVDPSDAPEETWARIETAIGDPGTTGLAPARYRLLASVRWLRAIAMMRDLRWPEAQEQLNAVEEFAAGMGEDGEPLRESVEAALRAIGPLQGAIEKGTLDPTRLEEARNACREILSDPRFAAVAEAALAQIDRIEIDHLVYGIEGPMNGEDWPRVVRMLDRIESLGGDHAPIGWEAAERYRRLYRDANEAFPVGEGTWVPVAVLLPLARREAEAHALVTRVRRLIAEGEADEARQAIGEINRLLGGEPGRYGKPSRYAVEAEQLYEDADALLRRRRAIGEIDALFDEGRTGEALERLGRLVASDGTYRVYTNRQELIRTTLDRRDTAIAAIDRGNDLAARRILQSIVDALDGAGRTENVFRRDAVEAIAELDTHLEEEIRRLIREGLAAWEAGDWTACADRMQRVLEIRPDNAAAREYLGKLRETAKRLFDEAYILRGMNPAEARSRLRTVLALVPEDDPLHARTARHLESLGE